MATPEFSFIATSRNDDHGGDVLRRTQTFINRLAEQCERHEVSAELILVEWNPPEARASLVDVLGWPRGTPWFSARVLTVPRRVHLAHRHGGRLSLFQMIAKNVGIRRAAGEYIIATNIDIIFSDELFQWMNCGGFCDATLYRSDRWDIPNEIQLESDFDALLKRAREEAIRHNRKDGTYIRRGDIFVNSTTERFDDVFYGPLKSHLRSFHETLTRSAEIPLDEMLSRLDWIISEEMQRLRRNFFIPILHTNGCGDFTMMSRRDWGRLRGYPEWQIFSWTIDSILLLQAYYNSIKIEELGPDCVHFHIEHDYGSGWTPEGASSLWTRLAERRIPYISYAQYTDLVYELQDNAERSIFNIYNGSDWGLYGRDIPSCTVVSQGTAARAPVATNTTALAENFFLGLRPVSLGTSIQTVLQPVNGVRADFISNSDGDEIAVWAKPERWSYAIEVDLSLLRVREGEAWIVISVAVDVGRVGAGIENSSHTDLIYETFIDETKRQWREVVIPVEEIADTGNLVLRNVSEDGRPARFRVNRVNLFTDWCPNDAPAMWGTRLADATDLEEAIISLERADLTAMRAASTGAIVRLLSGANPGVNGTGGGDRLFVRTPVEPGACGAFLNLPDAGPGARLSIDLHMIAGSAGIGICSRTTDQIVAEVQVVDDRPFTRVDLELAHAPDPSTLVVRNLSSDGPATLLIHRLAYEPGRVGITSD